MCRSEALASTASFNRSLTCRPNRILPFYFRQKGRGTLMTSDVRRVTSCERIGLPARGGGLAVLAQMVFLRVDVRQPAVAVGQLAVDDVEEGLADGFGD